jgi:hypothetical protein
MWLSMVPTRPFERGFKLRTRLELAESQVISGRAIADFAAQSDEPFVIEEDT